MAYQPSQVIQCQILFIHIDWIYMISFGWVLWHINYCRCQIQCQILFIHIHEIDMIWLSCVLWRIKHCRLFNAKSVLYIYIRYMIWFSWVLWHINHRWLFNTKSSYIYIKYIWFCLFGFYGISNIVYLVDCGCRKQRLDVCRGVRAPNECSWYDSKQSDRVVPVVLELQGMQRTP